jgi:hypothetical protein
MNTFHLIQDGPNWTLQREDAKQPLRVYAGVNQHTAMEKVTHELKGQNASLCIHIRQPRAIEHRWHRLAS